MRKKNGLARERKKQNSESNSSDDETQSSDSVNCFSFSIWLQFIDKMERILYAKSPIISGKFINAPYSGKSTNIPPEYCTKNYFKI